MSSIFLKRVFLDMKTIVCRLSYYNITKLHLIYFEIMILWNFYYLYHNILFKQIYFISIYI